MQVSVIIPVYNAAPFLDKSIQSALDQPQTGEVLLIDDRSTDDGWEICQSWVKKDPRVRIFSNSGPKGSGAARNVGLKNATCDYIAFLDADDYYLEGRFAETEKMFNRFENINGVGESVLVMDVLEDLQSYIVGCQKDYSKITPESFLYYPSFLITGFTVLKSSIPNIYFDETLKQTQDTDFIIKCLEVCEVMTGIYEKPIAVYNQHANNTIKNLSERDKYRAIFYKRYAKKAFLNYKNFKLFLKMIKYFRMYDYWYFFKGKYKNHLILKCLFIPVQIYRFFLPFHFYKQL